ncbi:LIF receptor subunit alpha b [Misgurnus anguillicaudatus]|uniref:LIF receptor subunit alpha b n=1 Tax=Misgurnus anguillicaudatus TaxID=75329 RepID=UPI003CCF30E7
MRSIMLVWVWCVLLASLDHQTFMIQGHLLPVKDVKVFPEHNITIEGGTWVLNVEWTDVENAVPEKLMYDIEVLLTEQEKRLHYETIEVKRDLSTPHRWKWTSLFPLECTSLSVRLRYRDQNQTGPWSPLYPYEGTARNPDTHVYPHDQSFLVGSNITFCCITETPLENCTIPISNRTYISEPYQLQSRTGQQNLKCGYYGATVFVGYPPDDQDLRCVTRDLISVECNWTFGRDTLVTEKTTLTKYTLNGRKCEVNKVEEFGHCAVNEANVTNWTLIAINPLGVKILNYTADPLHRVFLKAPTNVHTRAVYERNATINWDWNVKAYDSFLMICQVELNGHLYNKNFSGSRLTSIVLVDLQPFTNYTAKVSCGSSENFYMWGDWSDITRFRTKEDIPEALDVWIQYLEQNAYVLSKPLTKEQSHGVLTGYELTTIDPKNEISIQSETLCYPVSFGNKMSDRKISVSAKNSAGLSPPANITITSYPGVNVSQIRGINGGFNISWEERSSSSCGYVVDWFQTYSKKKCDLKWIKIPPGHLSTRIQSESLHSGVRYTVSVYSCTAGAPQLLQKSEGYAIEQRPSEKVQDLTGSVNGRNLLLSWKEVPLDEQKGFIQGYRVTTIPSGADKAYISTITNETSVQLTLDPGTYDITVAAFTSAGEGVNATFPTTMNKSHMYDEMIVAMVLGSSVAALVFIIIAFLCYRKKKWIKKMLYPDIPKPKLLGQWATKRMYCSQMTEPYIKCEIQEIHGIDPTSTSLEPAEDSALISSNSSSGPVNLSYQNVSELSFVLSYPSVTSFITSDPLSSSSDAKMLTSFIENPTYIMSWPADVSQISGPTLEMDDAYHPAPTVVQTFLETDGNYKPHALL